MPSRRRHSHRCQSPWRRRTVVCMPGCGARGDEYDTSLLSYLRTAGVPARAMPLAEAGYGNTAGARLATNSAKMALFAKSVSDAEILFGSTEKCIEAGLTGVWKD